MLKAIDAARYIISLDEGNNYFTYEGNARLNKMLHMAQNVFIGRTGKKLIDCDFYAYDDGGVIPDIQENFSYILATNDRDTYHVGEAEQRFLQKIFLMLKDAPIDELIAIDHEDPAWKEKCGYHKKSDQVMDSLKYADEYKDKYEAANFFMDKKDWSLGYKSGKCVQK